MQTLNQKTYGTKTYQIFYNNGSTSTPTVTVVEASQVQVSPGVSRDGDKVGPNPWSYSVITEHNIHGQMTYVNPSSTTINTGYLATTAGISSATYLAVLNQLDEEAYRDCLDNLYDRLKGVSDIASSFAEGGIKKATKGVLQAADDVRRQAGTYGLKTIGKAWLAAQYVWKPLISDIYNLSEAAVGHLSRKGFRVRVYGYATCSSGVVPINIGGYNFNAKPLGNYSSRCMMDFRFKVNSSFDTLAQLTSMDPLVIAWNVLPYSFVVDWFYNIGGYLASLEAAARYKSAYVSNGGYISRTRLVSLMYQHQGASSNAPSVSASFNSSLQVKKFSRTIQSGLPLPLSPQFKVKLGSGTLLNAAALLASKLRF